MDKNTNRLRIYDIAKEYKISSDALMKVLRGLGFTIKSHMSIASEDMLEAIADKFKHEIAEVKKDDEARRRKLLELEAHKRREDAEKLALQHKAEAEAKKKKALIEKKAKERAAKELAVAKKEPVITTPPEVIVEKPKVEIRAARPPIAAAPTLEKRRPVVKGPVKEPPRKGGRRVEQTPPAHKPTELVPKIRVSPEAAQKLEKRLQQSTAVSKAEKRRKKRDRGKKGRAAHVVDQEAVTLAFKKTMASIDGVKKVKKYKKRSAEDDTPEEETPVVEVTEFMTLSELAKVLDRRPAELVGKCLELGLMASINQRLDMDTIETLALEYGFGVEQVEEIGTAVMEEENQENLKFRPPVVTIMGHVDHGKTTLLDFIRKSNIAGGEAGEITQHIGAYAVQLPAGKITFLDTPGHEAFSAMRARGAQVTDIVVLVVSAVEAVMPQTIEAINHAKAANVPIIVAINKIDLPGANPDSVRQQLANLNLLSEAWGGKTIMVEVSAKKGTGVDKLLEMILLQSEVMELKADPDIKAQGAIIEARLEKGRGPVVTLLVQKGTLRVGTPFVAGGCFGRVRAMVDDRGREVTEVGPGMPVQVTGLTGVPYAGDTFMVTADESEARNISLKRQQIRREYEIRRVAPTTLESAYEKIKDGQITDLKIIIKGDVAGSVEALDDTLSAIGNEEVRVNIIHTGVGAITESDVLLAVASDAIIVGFHVTADARAREMANREKVDIRTYSIIYEVKENITKAVEGMLKPEVVEKWVGTAVVRQTFRVPKAGVISGSYVEQGRIRRGDKIRVSRNGVVVHEGTIGSLRRFKDDAREVAVGLECGIGLENFDDVKVDDQIEAYELVKSERKL